MKHKLKNIMFYLSILTVVSGIYFLDARELNSGSKLAPNSKAPADEVCLSEYRYDSNLPFLINDIKEPVVRQLSNHKFPVIFNSLAGQTIHYRSYYFSFSAFLRNRHFVLGEHSSLRAPPPHL